MRRTRRAPLLVLLALVGAVVATLAGSPPAGAHAVVVSSSPSADERLSAAPSEVSIVFSEPVTSDLGGITVLDRDGDRVDNDDSTQPTTTSVRTTLQPDLGDGTYVANYKVVSADGHPISGAVVFGVGNAQLGDVSGLVATGDPTTERLGVFARWLTYAAALLAAGLAFFLVFLHDGATDRRPMASVVQIATVVAALGAALAIAVQASLATGDGIGAVAQVDVLRGVLREGLGWSTGVLFVGLALCHVAVSVRPSVLAQALAFYGGLAVTTSFVFWGHAIEAPNAWLAVGADVVHVTVAAVWFGGLVGLAMMLRTRIRAARAAGLPEPSLVAGGPTVAARSLSAAVVEVADDDVDGSPRPAAGSLRATVEVVRRFSAAAAVSVVLVAVSGIALGWQELGSLSALTDSSYGQTLLVKLALVAVVLVLAGYNRFLLLPWLLAEPTDDPEPDDRTRAATPQGVAAPPADAPAAAVGGAGADAAAADPDDGRPRARRRGPRGGLAHAAAHGRGRGARARRRAGGHRGARERRARPHERHDERPLHRDQAVP